MSHETDKELADRLDAEKRIRNHDGTWKSCPDCNGLGFNPHSNMSQCWTCQGRGGLWEFPLMRQAHDMKLFCAARNVSYHDTH